MLKLHQGISFIYPNLFLWQFKTLTLLQAIISGRLNTKIQTDAKI